MRTPTALTIWVNVAAATLLLAAAPAAAEPAAGFSESQKFAVFAGLIGLVFAATGGGLLYFGIKSRNLAKASETWPIAGGTVLASSITKHTTKTKSGSNTTYRPHVRYAYEVAGVAHESEVIRFGTVEGTLAEAESFVAKYPAGAPIVARYNPANPKQATLETVSAGGSYIVMGAAFFACVVLIAVIGGYVYTTRWPAVPPAAPEQAQQPS